MLDALSTLRRCQAMWGSYEIVHERPSVSDVRDVIALPTDPGGSWGIFNRSGRALDEAMDRHGPNGTIGDRKTQVPISTLRSALNTVDETYIYGGFVNLHFGHFIVNTLPRLWPLIDRANDNYKILFHGQGNPKDWFGLPFIRDLFGALGLTEDRIVFIDRPMVFSRLIVPHPSFQEQSFAHRAFGQLCRMIGDNILRDHPLQQERNMAPAYLSKGNLKSGVGRFANENVVTEILSASGIEIIYPETLALPEQIALFRDRQTILGTAGSAFHNSVFVTSRAKIICISPSCYPNSNFMMLDALSGTHVTYLYAAGTETIVGGEAGFLTTLKFSNPEAVAKEMLQLL
ncbi:glycosyltransferase 61 family protein [Methylobacterium sp. Leaf108]|uniref:glycosyltransferase family 61 protein n=1 Tax=Methylobacterium sp. Leaf108 TaxID=1736256 RepID=UPI0009E87E1E|nr:glycosyltransferase 61 family protein [Methylobacterium sp. Leaf108]